VISSEGDEFRFAEQRGDGSSTTKLREGCSHLSQGHGIVDRCDGDIPAVENCCPALVWIDVGSRVEAPKGRLSAGSLPDSSRSKPGAYRPWSAALTHAHEARAVHYLDDSLWQYQTVPQ
jgi:hypothetical protein